MMQDCQNHLSRAHLFAQSSKRGRLLYGQLIKSIPLLFCLPPNFFVTRKFIYRFMYNPLNICYIYLVATSCGDPINAMVERRERNLTWKACANQTMLSRLTQPSPPPFDISSVSRKPCDGWKRWPLGSSCLELRPSVG